MPNIGDHADKYVIIEVEFTDLDPSGGLRELQKQISQKMYGGFMPIGGIGVVMDTYRVNVGGGNYSQAKKSIFFQAMIYQHE